MSNIVEHILTQVWRQGSRGACANLYLVLANRPPCYWRHLASINAFLAPRMPHTAYANPSKNTAWQDRVRFLASHVPIAFSISVLSFDIPILWMTAFRTTSSILPRFGVIILYFGEAINFIRPNTACTKVQNIFTRFTCSGDMGRSILNPSSPHSKHTNHFRTTVSILAFKIALWIVKGPYSVQVSVVCAAIWTDAAARTQTPVYVSKVELVFKSDQNQKLYVYLWPWRRTTLPHLAILHLGIAESHQRPCIWDSQIYQLTYFAWQAIIRWCRSGPLKPEKNPQQHDSNRASNSRRTRRDMHSSESCGFDARANNVIISCDYERIYLTLTTSAKM